ncbi:hypothetical protein JCM3775_002083 [Rhodotorula graminis]
MITLQILPVSGNVNNFPYTGVLGVTDVVVRGRVVAGLDERASGKAPEVRCIAVRLVRVDAWDGKASRDVTKDVVDERVLWTPESGADAERLEPREHRFALRVPHDVVGLSKMQFKVGTCQASVTWRIEAYVDTVKVGRIEAQHSRNLSLVRHATVPLFPPDAVQRGWAASTSAASPVPFSYDLRISGEPFGVLEPLAVETHFRLPEASGVQIKSFKLWLRRDVTNLKSNAQFQTTHDFAIESDELVRPGRSSKRFASVFTRSSSSVGPSATTTPPSEDERTLHGRPPSPPSDPESSVALAPHRFPLFARETAEVVERGKFHVRVPGQGPHRWTVGETGESSVFRISFSLAGKISYKLRNGSSFSVDLAPLPVHVCAAIDPQLSRVSSRTSTAATLLSRLADRRGDRRTSGFALELKFDRSSPGPPPSPLASPDAGLDRRLPTAPLPHLTCRRPHHGRRMSEHSDANDAPARTRVRRDPPAPLPLPNATMHSPSSVTSAPPGVSRSSTLETLGPITPSTMEFLVTSPEPPSAPSSSSSHLAPRAPSHPPFSPSHSPQMSRHSARSCRSSSARYRPRSAGSQRSSVLGDSSQSVSNMSIASVATASSTASDPLRSPPLAGSSSTLLGSADRMLGLSLGGGGASVEGLRTSTSAPLLPAAEEGEDGDARMDLLDDPSAHLASPSPPSSPEPPLPVLAPSSSSFRDPFAIDDSSDAPPAEPDMYVSPRHARLASRPGRPSTAPAHCDARSASGLTAPASPPLLSAYAPQPETRLVSPPVVVVDASATGPSRASSASPGPTAATAGAAVLPAVGSRKGSIGVFISSILGRRGSRPLTAL